MGRLVSHMGWDGGGIKCLRNRFDDPNKTDSLIPSCRRFFVNGLTTDSIAVTAVFAAIEPPVFWKHRRFLRIFPAKGIGVPEESATVNA